MIYQSNLILAPCLARSWNVLRVTTRSLLAGLAVFSLQAQTGVARWDFNDTNTPPSPAPVLGQGSAALLGGLTATFASGTGSSDPATATDEAWNLSGFPAQGAEPRTAGVQFAASTAGFENVNLRFDWRASNTGSRRLVVLCSTDGASFLEATNFTIAAGSTFKNGFTVDLNALPDVRDDPNFAFQLVSDFADGSQYLPADPGSKYGTTGTWRFDMVTVLGTPVGAGPTITNIASLRALVDPQTGGPSDPNTLYTVEGVVTTWTNLATTANIEFFVQDATAGIAVAVKGGGAVNCPPAGARVRVTGPLAGVNGLLELGLAATNLEHNLTVLSTGNPLPSPVALDFTWTDDCSTIEAYEGSYVVASNVFLSLDPPAFKTGGDTVTITNDTGGTFALRVDARTDMGGQLKPAGPVTIYGVLGQNTTTLPATNGYQLMPTRFADLTGAAKAPAVRFTNVLSNLIRPGDALTNTFAEQCLRPGEKLTIHLDITDPEGRAITVYPATNGLPATAEWSFVGGTGGDLTGTFTAQPMPDEAGSQFVITLQAANDGATNGVSWMLYVPTAVEQQIIIAEYLANPTSAVDSPFFNPLNRPQPAPSPSRDDEYVEIVNCSDQTVDFAGWTLADAGATAPRLRVYESTPVGSSNAVVFYGGPAGDPWPQLDVPFVSAQESSAGLSLNNDGDTILLRNAASNLVARVVYTSAMVSSTGSMTRYPDVNSPFVPQSSVGTSPVTPGRQYDGKLWSEPSTLPPVEIGPLAATLNADGSVTLAWTAQPGRDYTVLAADRADGGFVELGSGLKAGQFTDNTLGGVGARFYRVRSP
jgi:hypothetical protein